MEKIQKAILGTFLTNIIFLLVGFITSIFTTRFLGPEGRGVFAIFQANITLFTMLFTFNISGAIIYYFTNKELSSSNIVGGSIAGLLSGLLLLSLVLFALYFSGYIDLLFPKEYSSWYYIIFVLSAFVLISSYNFFQSGLRAIKEFRILNNSNLIMGFSSLAYFSVLYFFIGSDSKLSARLDLAIWGYALIYLVPIFITIALFWNRIFKNIKVDFDLKSSTATAFPFIITGLAADALNFINYRVDFWFVEHFVGIAQLGLYSLAVSLGQLLWVVPAAIGLVLMPYLNEKTDEKERRKVFLLYSRLTFTSLLLLAILGVLLAPFMIPLIYGANFSGSLFSFQLLLIGIVFSGLTKVTSMFIVVLGKFNWNVWSVALGALVTIVLDCLLIPIYGIEGASIATSLSYISIFLVLFFFIRRSNDLNYSYNNMFILAPKDIRMVLKSIYN